MASFVFSSEIYKITPSDLAVLKDYEGNDFSIVSDEIVVLLGHNQQITDNSSPDLLISGRAAVQKAVEEKKPFIPVRFVFTPANKRFDVFSPVIRKLRYKIRFYGSNVYHLDPKDIRAMKIERTIKTRDNAYSFTNPKYKMSLQERSDEYDRIFNSVKNNGFNDEEPIDIMLCRLAGAKDCLNNGHHRMGIAIELGLNRIPVRFSAAGASPKILRPFLKWFSTINLALKRRFGH